MKKMMNRVCTKCNNNLPIDCFYKTKNGYKTQCKECIKSIEKNRRNSKLEVILHNKKQQRKISLFNNDKIECSKCKKIKNKIEFSLEIKSWNGYRSDCNDCKNARIRHYNKNTGYRKKYMHNYLKNKNNQLADNLRSRLRKAIKNNQKTGSAVKDLGCSIEELKKHLESKFTEGMSWDNYGEWHIDHIKPLSSFNLENREELLKACNYNNLQPLWAKDNLSKGDRYE